MEGIKDIYIVIQTMLDTENNNCIVTNTFGVYPEKELAVKKLERAFRNFLALDTPSEKIEEKMEECWTGDSSFVLKLSDGSKFLWQVKWDSYYEDPILAQSL